MGAEAEIRCGVAGSSGGYRRWPVRLIGVFRPSSELRLPHPHARQPGLGLREGPAVVGLEDIGDGEHHVERLAVVAAALTGGALQGLAELEQLELLEPVALLKGREGVALLLLQERLMGRRGGAAGALPQASQAGQQRGQGEQEGSRSGPDRVPARDNNPHPR